jgi:hypothetical protein
VHGNPSSTVDHFERAAPSFRANPDDRPPAVRAKHDPLRRNGYCDFAERVGTRFAKDYR